MLEAHTAALEHDTRVVMELVSRGQTETAEAFRARIHDAEGVDHEMLDEAIGFALSRRDE